MSVFFVLMVLVLGYHYTLNVPSEKIGLRRSVGWETYVYLAYRGLEFIFYGVVALGVLYIPLIIFLWGVDWLFGVVWELKFKKVLVFVLFDGIQIYHLIIALFSYAICQNRIKEEREKCLQDQLRKYDGVLNIVLEAAAKQIPIRVSLKSRKVYVGLIMEEQFERTDLDCILLIPLLSGYRDKDNLDIFFDCSYYPVYEKNGLFKKESFDKEQILKLQDFRIALRVAEVESVSLFYFDLYDQFERFKKSETSSKISSG